LRVEFPSLILQARDQHIKQIYTVVLVCWWACKAWTM